MAKANREGEGNLDWKKALLRGSVGIPVLLGSVFALTLLQYKAVIAPGKERMFALLSLLIAAIVSALSGAVGAKRRKLAAGALGECGLVMMLLLLVVFTKEGGLFNMSFAAALLVLICGGFIGSILSAGAMKRAGVRRRI